uniref:Uncharacterized protein n=1 Tax=Candidatus Kentrum sp. LFY TaxID=2126342 RepID=A0A450WEE9_9GAMM|nr:MAG: hypothetical protein BECKLFY1418C_GA0070996_101518 [Candidatus Kentron sp. LFY]
MKLRQGSSRPLGDRDLGSVILIIGPAREQVGASCQDRSGVGLGARIGSFGILVFSIPEYLAHGDLRCRGHRHGWSTHRGLSRPSSIVRERLGPDTKFHLAPVSGGEIATAPSRRFSTRISPRNGDPISTRHLPHSQSQRSLAGYRPWRIDASATKDTIICLFPAQLRK